MALFVDENNAAFNGALSQRQEERRSARGAHGREARRGRLRRSISTPIRADVGDGVWGRPHLARALVRAGYAASNDDAFDRFLGRNHPWYVPYEKWKAVEVVAAIREAGGVSSLAHAVWYKESDTLIRALAGVGLDALEVFHPDHDAACEGRLSALAAELGLAATAGSDFHGARGPQAPGRRLRRRRDARGLRARRSSSSSLGFRVSRSKWRQVL